MPRCSWGKRAVRLARNSSLDQPTVSFRPCGVRWHMDGVEKRGCQLKACLRRRGKAPRSARLPARLLIRVNPGGVISERWADLQTARQPDWQPDKETRAARPQCRTPEGDVGVCVAETQNPEPRDVAARP